MKRWYTVYTKPRQEKVALENLQRQHYEVYLPLIRVRKLIRKRWQEVIEPLFPRYLFVHVDIDEEHTAPIRSTRGVAGLVKFGNRAVPISDQIIDYFLTSADDSGVIPFRDPAIRPGDKVTVTTGPLHGVEAIYDADTGEDRAMILIEVLGRINKVSVPRKDINPI
mgnify:CR=1 FL=1